MLVKITSSFNNLKIKLWKNEFFVNQHNLMVFLSMKNSSYYKLKYSYELEEVFVA